MAALSVSSAAALPDLLPGSRATTGSNRFSAVENLAPTLYRISGVESIDEDSKRSMISVCARSREYSRQLISVRARVRGRDALNFLSQHHPIGVQKPLTSTQQKKQEIRPRLRGRVHATQDDEIADQDGLGASPPSNTLPDKKAAAKAEAEKGRRTAIITGLISVLLGVGYLVLIQLLDTRGVNLIPPPPEAYDP